MVCAYCAGQGKSEKQPGTQSSPDFLHETLHGISWFAETGVLEAKPSLKGLTLRNG